MRSKDNLSPDQNNAIDRLYENDETLLVAKTGAGKTVIALTAIAELMESGDLGRVLIIAPLKVCETAWRNEPNKWEHLHGIDIAIATGDPSQREEAIYSYCGLVVINEENVDWLTQLNGGDAITGFDGLLIDETSHWTDGGSTATGSRFKALRDGSKHFKWRCGMTAQPVAENWLGLYGQMLLLDRGKRLGKRKGKWQRDHFYAPDPYNPHKWELLPGQDKVIADKIRDIVHIVPDYKKDGLPEKHLQIQYINMDEDSREIYNTMRRTKVLKLTGNITIEAENRAALSGKLEQIANGFSYIDHGEGIPAGVVVHHRYKKEWIVNRAREIISEGDKEPIDRYDAFRSGENLIIVYWFKEDLAWLRPAFPGALELAGGADVEATMERWQSAERGQVLFLHPASAGHGVDGLQDTCHRQLWVAPCWSRDKWMQTPDRIWRTGQDHEVFIEVCVMVGTVDEVKLAAAEGKGEYDELFLQHLQEK